MTDSTQIDDRPFSVSGPYKPTILPMNKAKMQPHGNAKLRQYATAIIVNVATLAAGSVMGWPSPAGPLLKSETDPAFQNATVTEEQMSWVASVNMLAGMAGTFLYGVLADYWGRRLSGLSLAVPFTLSWLLVGFTSSLEVLYVARILAGIASGGAMVVAPLFVAETAEDEHRGKLGTLLAVGVNGGILYSYLVGAVTGYRGLALVCMILPLIYFLGLIKLPDTPVYLLKKKRELQAKKSLKWYRGEKNVDAELESMRIVLRQQESEGASIKDLFTHTGNRRALFTALGLLSNQQLCGVIAVLNYTEEIFTKSGSQLDPVVSSIVVGSLQAIMTYLSSFLIDRMGRKTLLIWSNVVMALCLITLGGCFYANDHGINIANFGWLPVTSMGVYVSVFALGVGPVPLVMLAEIFSTKVRSRATSISIACQLTFAFLTTKFFSTISSSFGGMYNVFWFFAFWCVLGVIFSLTYVMETKGKNLEQILSEYNGDSYKSREDVENAKNSEPLVRQQN